jgi:anaphase-promoting complex subunit 2
MSIILQIVKECNTPSKEFLKEFLSKICAVEDSSLFDNIESNQSEINFYIVNNFACVVPRELKAFVSAIFSCLEGKPPIPGGMDAVQIKILRAMGWHNVFRKVYLQTFNQIITNKIIKACSSDYSVKCFDKYSKWFETWFLPLTSHFFSDQMKPLLYEELYRHSIEHVAKIRSNELFDMVSDYPESLVAVRELRDYAARSDSLGFIGRSFKSTLQKRLLHLGASTTQILDMYISTVHIMRTLDPSEVLLQFVETPVRHYLKSRKDAVRCIVSSLTEEKESELHGELRQGRSLEYGIDEDDEEDGPGDNWMPLQRQKELPMESFNTTGGSRGLDVLALLVSIYGSTDLFIVEYRTLLADKLKSNFNSKFSTDNEIATLELLKIR